MRNIGATPKTRSRNSLQPVAPVNHSLTFNRTHLVCTSYTLRFTTTRRYAWYYIGFDRATAAQGLPIYLQLLHATVSDAIEWRCKRLSLGRTALEPKAALGAKPEDMCVWLRHRVPAMNWVLRGLLGGIPHAEAPERN